MNEVITIDGIRLDIDRTAFGGGGQGEVFRCSPVGATSLRLIAKQMSARPSVFDRSAYLVRQKLHHLSPAFAGPIAAEDFGDGSVWHLAPFVQGISLDEDRPRSLPENIEIALEFVSLLAILADHGLGHGDIALSNVLIGPDGTVNLIDFDGYLSSDPACPPPLTIGQRPMQAPELRLQQISHPTFETDRFAMGVYLSILLTGRYPTEGLGDTPAEVDRLMTQGIWPERQRLSAPDELPIEALGPEIQGLFDRAFSLDPHARPTPDEWRLVLTEALDNCWIHDCGNAFVAGVSTSQCPWCHASVQIVPKTRSLKITLVDSGHRYRVELKEAETIILGRATIPDLPKSVSGRHLEITPYGDKLLLRHVGRHDTLITVNGQWYKLKQHWLALGDLSQNQGVLKLADSEVRLAVE